MTIRVEKTRRRFGRTDFAPLELHYQEQVLQIHVMEEFVNRGLDAIAAALQLAMDYFALDRDTFLRRWGDDDQNIYGYAGAAVKCLRRFEEDYKAKTVYLTQNYRSTGHIIAAANAWIASARDRMKAEHPIEIDRARRRKPKGGDWESRDAVGRGRVQVLRIRGDDRSQAMAALAEIRRLADLTSDWDWRTCAVIARNWRYLDPLRSLCERKAIPVQAAREDASFFWRLREVRRLRDWLGALPSGLVTGDALEAWLARQPDGDWSDVLTEALDNYLLETGGAETSVQAFTAWLAEWGRELRRRQTSLLLLTAHRAKGLEFDHVVILDGGWGRTTPTTGSGGRMKCCGSTTLP